MELEGHINKLKISTQAFTELKGLTIDQAITLALAAHKEYALDQRTEYIQAGRQDQRESNKDAWKKEPASPSQKDTLHKAKIDFKPELTKGEADILIKELTAKRAQK